MNNNLIFIKFGGSLITDKDRENHAQETLIQGLFKTLRTFLDSAPDTAILLGHGSGSFGHAAAAKHQTRSGVRDADGWLGYQKVWQAARTLHNIVMDLGLSAGLPLVSFPPSAMISACGGQTSVWNLEPIAVAFENGLIPVVYGDVVVDEELGGTILSTEELFVELAASFQPGLVLLAGKENGVYTDFPACQTLLPHLTCESLLMDALQGSNSIDVTGGMREKVLLMQSLCALSPETQVRIFSALEPLNLLHALHGAELGTLITYQ